jgi:hypothetical protein
MIKKVKKLGYFFYYEKLEEDVKRCMILNLHKYEERIGKNRRKVDNLIKIIKD